MKKLFFVLSLIIFVAPLVASADGVIFPPPDYWMQETDQKAVIFHEKDTETMIISISFRGDAEDFSWVVPTPSRPEVEKSTDELFTSLEKLTAPQYGYRGMPMYDVMEGAMPASQGVTVVETKKVEYYDIAVLEADDPEALTKWLNENKYNFPEEAKYLLEDYIINKWYFTAIKIDTSSLGRNVEAQLRQGHAVPLKFTFASSKIVYPLKISGISEYFKQPSSGPAPMMEGRSYDSEVIATDEMPTAQNCSGSDECGGLFCPQVVGQDTPCCIDGQCVCGPSDCRGTSSASVPELYPMPSPYPWQPDVSVMLYVFSDHKKELPGFNIDYAAWVKSKDIEKLAIESDGEPWVETSVGKYYLTKLSRYMQPSEMTYDLYLRDASDNDTVGVVKGEWTNALIGILIFFAMLSIFLVVGFISPLGLIFAICTLLQFFIKSKAVHVIAWIFQGLMLLVTTGVGALWLFGWYQYGEVNWYGVAPYNWSYAYTKSLFAAGLGAWILFVALMVGIMIWQVLRLRKKIKT